VALLLQDHRTMSPRRVMQEKMIVKTGELLSVSYYIQLYY